MRLMISMGRPAEDKFREKSTHFLGLRSYSDCDQFSMCLETGNFALVLLSSVKPGAAVCLSLA